MDSLLPMRKMEEISRFTKFQQRDLGILQYNTICEITPGQGESTDKHPHFQATRNKRLYTKTFVKDLIFTNLL